MEKTHQPKQIKNVESDMGWQWSAILDEMLRERGSIWEVAWMKGEQRLCEDLGRRYKCRGCEAEQARLIKEEPWSPVWSKLCGPSRREKVEKWP